MAHPSAQFETNSKRLTFAESGRFFVERSAAFGVCLSYRPMFYQLAMAIYGNPKEVFTYDAEGHEEHVDRVLNVIGSGFMHKRYFDDMMGVFVQKIFDSEPVEQQPTIVADMGCGDGTLLKTIFKDTAPRTARLPCTAPLRRRVPYPRGPTPTLMRSAPDIPPCLVRSQLREGGGAARQAPRQAPAQDARRRLLAPVAQGDRRRPHRRPGAARHQGRHRRPHPDAGRDRPSLRCYEGPGAARALVHRPRPAVHRRQASRQPADGRHHRRLERCRLYRARGAVVKPSDAFFSLGAPRAQHASASSA